MSIIIKNSQESSIEIGYFGFYRLRRRIAELAAPDIYNAYLMVPDVKSETEKKEYNQYLNRLEKKYSDDSRRLVLDFLYASDCDGSMDAEHCKAVYDLIKDCKDETQYGYVDRAVWEIPATIPSFAGVLKEAVEDSRFYHHLKTQACTLGTGRRNPGCCMETDIQQRNRKSSVHPKKFDSSAMPLAEEVMDNAWDSTYCRGIGNHCVIPQKG